MGIKSRNQIEKEQAHLRNKKFLQKAEENKTFDELSDVEKIDIQIAEIKSRIKNVSYDYYNNSSLKKSEVIKNKLKIMNDSLKKLEEEKQCKQNVLPVEES